MTEAALDSFDPLAASAEARRRGLGPIAEREFVFGAANAHGVLVPPPAAKFAGRRGEGFFWYQAAQVRA